MDRIIRSIHLVTCVVWQYLCDSLSLRKHCFDQWLSCRDRHIMISAVFVLPFIICRAVPHTERQFKIRFWIFYRYFCNHFAIDIFKTYRNFVSESTVPGKNVPVLIILCRSVILDHDAAWSWLNQFRKCCVRLIAVGYDVECDIFSFCTVIV